MTSPTHDVHSRHTDGSQPVGSRSQRFLASRYWLVLKNLLGWPLILAAFVAGPLVPGPGGIPLFLMGFALVWFPGKRRLTARALRGRPVTVRRGRFLLVSLGLSLALAAPALWLARWRVPWVADRWSAGPVVAMALYALTFAVLWLAALSAPRTLNLVLR